jgi:hypothetical protein
MHESRAHVATSVDQGRKCSEIPDLQKYRSRYAPFRSRSCTIPRPYIKQRHHICADGPYIRVHETRNPETQLQAREVSVRASSSLNPLNPLLANLYWYIHQTTGQLVVHPVSLCLPVTQSLFAIVEYESPDGADSIPLIITLLLYNTLQHCHYRGQLI